MEAIRRERGVWEVINAPLIANYKDFEGNKFGDGGTKKFSIIIDDDIAEQFQDLGWYIRTCMVKRYDDEFGYTFFAKKKDLITEEEMDDYALVKYIDVKISDKYPRKFLSKDIETGKLGRLNNMTVKYLDSQKVYTYDGYLTPSKPWEGNNGDGLVHSIYGGNGVFKYYGGRIENEYDWDWDAPDDQPEDPDIF